MLFRSQKRPLSRPARILPTRAFASGLLYQRPNKENRTTNCTITQFRMQEKNLMIHFSCSVLRFIGILKNFCSVWVKNPVFTDLSHPRPDFRTLKSSLSIEGRPSVFRLFLLRVCVADRSLFVNCSFQHE